MKASAAPSRCSQLSHPVRHGACVAEQSLSARSNLVRPCAFPPRTDQPRRYQASDFIHQFQRIKPSVSHFWLPPLQSRPNWLPSCLHKAHNRSEKRANPNLDLKVLGADTHAIRETSNQTATQIAAAHRAQLASRVLSLGDFKNVTESCGTRLRCG
jgi:hypothetical protein